MNYWLDKNIDFPAFVLDFPDSYNTAQANNVWMKEIPDSQRKVNKYKAYYDL